MITRHMKSQLASAGYSEIDVRNMTPANAHEALQAAAAKSGREKAAKEREETRAKLAKEKQDQSRPFMITVTFPYFVICARKPKEFLDI